MKKIFLVIKAEIEKQQKHDYHSAFVYLSLLIWPILGFLEVYYTYKPFSLTGYMGISDSKELLAFLGTGFMSYTCFWSHGRWRIRKEKAALWKLLFFPLQTVWL